MKINTPGAQNAPQPEADPSHPDTEEDRGEHHESLECDDHAGHDSSYSIAYADARGPVTAS